MATHYHRSKKAAEQHVIDLQSLGFKASLYKSIVEPSIYIVYSYRR